MKENKDYFLVVDCKKYEMQINLESIMVMQENKDGKLSIVYYVPKSKKEGFKKKSDTYDCFEIQDILKLFNTLKTELEANMLVNG